jgi:Secretion system C-terminal sorting domain
MKKTFLAFSMLFALGTASAQIVSQDFEGPLNSSWVGNGAIVGSQGASWAPYSGNGMYDLSYDDELYVTLNLPAVTKYIGVWINEERSSQNSITIDLKDPSGNLVRNISTINASSSGYWSYCPYQLGAGYSGNHRISFKRSYVTSAIGAYSTFLDDITVSTSNPTSVVETIAAEDFRLYPNPVQEKFNLVFRADIADLSIDIMDVTGKIVHSEKNSISLAANESKEINVSHLNAGVYFCKIQNGKSSFVQKIMVETAAR